MEIKYYKSSHYIRLDQSFINRKNNLYELHNISGTRQTRKNETGLFIYTVQPQ